MFSPAIRQLSGVNPSGLPRPELVDLVNGLRRLQGAIAATEARVIVAIDSLDDGGLNGAGVLRVAGRKSGRAAARISATAEMLIEMPLTSAALESGDITWPHATAIASAAEKTSPGLADAGLAGRAAACPADVFFKDCREWVARNLPDPPNDPNESAARQRADRGVTDWTGRDGMSNIHIKLPPADGFAFLSELDLAANRLFNDDGGRDADPSDVRTFAQRRADALMGMIWSGGRASASPRHPSINSRWSPTSPAYGSTTPPGWPKS